MNWHKRLGRRLPSSPSVPAAVQFGPLLASLLTMAWFVEARDPYTGGHLWRVSRYAWLLAESAGFSKAECTQFSLGGFLHDLGKIGVPDAILRKPSRLDNDEYAVIKTHPDMGLRMLSGHPLAQLVCDAILSHHERPDGRGYPRGLASDAIPVMARIVAIGDAFDAMTSHRPYRPGMPRERAAAIIGEGRGTQFDLHLTDRFIELSDSGHLDHIIGHSDAGIPLLSCPTCGPIIVVCDNHNEGDHAVCRNCGGEFVVEKSNRALVATWLGVKADAAKLEPEVDNAQIARTVHAAITTLPVGDLMTAANTL